MKTNLRKLRLLIYLGIIDPSDFYCITVYEDVINLQGHYSSDKLKKYSKWNSHVIDDTGYIKLNYSNLEFTFTE